MRRHLIAGALACLGSSAFGQTITNPTNQVQGVPNQIQDTLKNVVPSTQAKVDAGVQQNSGANGLGNAQNQSTLNAQGQVNGASGLNGNLGVQSDTNLQNNSNGQPGQLNSNLSTQVQGQSSLGTQQRQGIVPQDNFSQQRNNFQTNGIQWNGNNGSQLLQQQGQPMQPGQRQSQVWNSQTNQNTGAINRAGIESGNLSQGGNMQQPGQSQITGPVYLLRFDASGREYICVNGSAVYFDNVNSLAGQGNQGNQYRAGYGSYDGNKGDNSKDRPSNNNPPVPSTNSNESSEVRPGDSTKLRTVDPSNANNPADAKYDACNDSSDSRTESKL